MAHLLFDTDDMGHAAAQMGQTAGDLLSRIGGIGPGAILMPPALEVETAEVVAGSMRDLAESAGFYGANAADLVERTAIVLAENAGDGVVLSAGSFIRGLFSAEAAGYSAVRVGPLALATRGRADRTTRVLYRGQRRRGVGVRQRRLRGRGAPCRK